MTDRRAFLRLLALPLSGWMALAVLLGAATIASSIGLMGASAFIIASAALQPPLDTLQVAIVGVRFFGIARGVFRYLERYISHQVTFRLLARLRVWFYSAVEPLAPAGMAHHRSGDLLSRVVADIETLENFYVRVIAPPVVALAVSLGSTAFSARYHRCFGLVLLLGLATGGLVVPVLSYLLSRRPGRRSVALRADLNTHLVDSIQGLADLVAVGQMEVRRRQTHALTRALAAQQLRLAQIDGLADALANGTLVLTTLAVLLVGIPLVRVSSITGIDLAVLVLVTIASFEAVLPLPAAFLHLESCLTAGRRLFEIVDQKPAVIAPSRPAEEPGQIDLSIHDLHFAYAPGEQPALDGLSFDLPAGKRLAVVGPSGAGKTTIANLLLRFYEDEAGAIWLGGRPLRDYDPEMVRRLFAVIRQDTGLFNMTIRENLLLARPDASEPDLIAACQRAQIHEWIAALPAGCDTRVGEQGVKLSGGERQRVAIARAILKDAPVLLLDEPTANLDALSERAVMHTLLDILPGRSVLLITHRLVGLETFDEILVLVEGRIVERGTHAELLSQTDGLYHRMLTLQNEFLRETL